MKNFIFGLLVGLFAVFGSWAMFSYVWVTGEVHIEALEAQKFDFVWAKALPTILIVTVVFWLIGSFLDRVFRKK
ncbi:MAG: hypothetical protein HY707_14340 [Ignavibacteriae bacterium]|nr:hypothetical protein [Ignavibacteriota bacterium]